MLLNVKGKCPLHSVKFEKIPSGANMKSALKPKKPSVASAFRLWQCCDVKPSLRLWWPGIIYTLVGLLL